MFTGSQAMYYMDQNLQSKALDLACDLSKSLSGINIEVGMFPPLLGYTMLSTV